MEPADNGLLGLIMDLANCGLRIAGGGLNRNGACGQERSSVWADHGLLGLAWIDSSGVDLVPAFSVHAAALKGSDASGENRVFLRATLEKDLYLQGSFAGSSPRCSGRHSRWPAAPPARRRAAPVASGFPGLISMGGIGAHSSWRSSSPRFRSVASCSIRRSFHFRCAQRLIHLRPPLFPFHLAHSPASPCQKLTHQPKGQRLAHRRPILPLFHSCALSPRRTATSSASSCSTHSAYPRFRHSLRYFGSVISAPSNCARKMVSHLGQAIEPLCKAFAHFVPVAAFIQFLPDFPRQNGRFFLCVS